MKEKVVGVNVYGYVRVSTVLQAKEGESLEAQSQQVTSYAQSRGLTLPVANVLIEAGVSGSTGFELRPRGAQLLSVIQPGDIVIFPKLDRAFRNTRNALNMLHHFKEAGVSVHFIDLGGDVTGNGIGAIVFTILAAFATFERERIATRIREVKQMQKAQGKFTGGRRAFGYNVVDGLKVPHADEQHVITKMIELRSQGLSYRKIGAWLAESEGVALSTMGVRGVLLGAASES